jgi:hypothetical protein
MSSPPPSWSRRSSGNPPLVGNTAAAGGLAAPLRAGLDERGNPLGTTTEPARSAIEGVGLPHSARASSVCACAARGTLAGLSRVAEQHAGARRGQGGRRRRQCRDRGPRRALPRPRSTRRQPSSHRRERALVRRGRSSRRFRASVGPANRRWRRRLAVTTAAPRALAGAIADTPCCAARTAPPYGPACGRPPRQPSGASCC